MNPTEIDFSQRPAPIIIDSAIAPKDDLATRYTFVTDILSALPTVASEPEKFQQLLEQDVRGLLSNVTISSTIATEVLFRLQAILDKLKLLISSTAVHEKTVVAVGGGYSSGKSSFVTSFIEDQSLRLPVGIEPITSIPTYVASASGSVIRGHTWNGGVINIDPALYGQLSHAFVHGFGFNLRDILPCVSMETPLRGLRHIAFIDLPGYDAATSTGAHTEGDRLKAREFIAQAQALIWLIGLDSNGEIPASDIDFLLAQQADERPLYVVLNKADVRPVDDVIAVLDQCRDTLDQADVIHAGLCAYSSTNGTPIQVPRPALDDFSTPTGSADGCSGRPAQ